MWKTINQLTNKRPKTTNINELLINDESVKEPELIADTMNSYFCDIGPFLANNLSNSDNCFEAYINATNTTFEIQKISDLDVKSEILKIKTSKATGPDRISPKLLKDTVVWKLSPNHLLTYSTSLLNLVSFLMILRLHAHLLYIGGIANWSVATIDQYLLYLL